jgi:hypothetical protein
MDNPFMPEREHSGRRRCERDALAEEARRLAEDPVDTAEMRAVKEDMDALSPDWPYDADEPPQAG